MAKCFRFWAFICLPAALTAQDGTPWFNAVDVCKALGYKRPNDAVALHVEKDDTVKYRTNYAGKVREMNFINESGLYSLVLSSKLPNAKAFKRWVTSEVLPSLRKHGAYLTPEALKRSLADPGFVQGLVCQLAEEQQRVKKFTLQIEQERPRVKFSMAVEQSVGSILVRDLARILRQNGVEIGERRLYQWLRDRHYLCSHGKSWNRPTQWSMDRGLFEVKETPVSKPDGTVFTAYTTMVTGKGQVYFVNNIVRLTSQELRQLAEESAQEISKLHE